MKKFLVIALWAMVGFSGEKAPELMPAKDSTLFMSSHEVRGLDKRELVLVDETSLEVKPLKEGEFAPADWKRRRNETANEILWW